MIATQPSADATAATAAAAAPAQLGNLFVAPASALEYADRHPGMSWLPFGITLALNAALGIWFALSVNLAAWRTLMMHAVALNAPPEAASRAIEMYAQHGRGFLLIGAIGGIVGLAIAELLYALYLYVADRIFSADARSYGRWFSFTAWTWLPAAIGYVAALIAWAVTAHGNATVPDVTTLNALIFHFAPGDRYFKLAQFSILDFWVIGLVTYGLRRWRGYSIGKALAIALLPFVVVYCIVFFA